MRSCHMVTRTRRLKIPAALRGWPSAILGLVAASAIYLAVRLPIGGPVNALDYFVIGSIGGIAANATDPFVLALVAIVLIDLGWWLTLALAVAGAVLLQAISPYGFHELWLTTTQDRAIAILVLGGLLLPVVRWIRNRRDSHNGN